MFTSDVRKEKKCKVGTVVAVPALTARGRCLLQFLVLIGQLTGAVDLERLHAIRVSIKKYFLV